GPYRQFPPEPVLCLRRPLFQRRSFRYENLRGQWGLCPRSLEELWSQWGGRLPYAAVRDAAYLRWRYLQRPGVRYHGVCLFRHDEPLAGLIFRAAKDRLALVDWVAPPEAQVWEMLLAAVSDSFKLASGTHLEAWLTGDPETAQVLRDLGFSSVHHPDLALVVRCFHPALDPASVPGAFFTTWGDTDLI
ncbi:MAG: hypothetical protein N2447_01340, partial [Thermoanaerobaculum sp.]|nr:hypothetical protein [Thermoanaerobaculum sp.]